MQPKCLVNMFHKSNQKKAKIVTYISGVIKIIASVSSMTYKTHLYFNTQIPQHMKVNHLEHFFVDFLDVPTPHFAGVSHKP